MVKIFRRHITAWQPTGLADWLLLSCLFSGMLLAARMATTGTLEYIFLPWNLFLASVPYILTQWMERLAPLPGQRLKLAAACLGWLLFIPNSFYIITDLFHLSHVHTAPRWFDLLLVFSFAWNGILFGILSLFRVEQVLRLLKGRGFSILLVFVVMWLCAWGIYIGRFLRYNSWDVIANPAELAGEMWDMIRHPFRYGYAWGMTICYAVFMTLLYFTLQAAGARSGGRMKEV